MMMIMMMMMTFAQLLEDALREVQNKTNRPTVLNGTSAGRGGSASNVTFDFAPKDAKDSLLEEALSGLKQMGWGASNSFAARVPSPQAPAAAAAGGGGVAAAASPLLSHPSKTSGAIDPLEQLINSTVPSVNGMSFATLSSSSWQAELDRLVAASAARPPPAAASPSVLSWAGIGMSGPSPRAG
jgi:hypothetical protein